MTVKLTDDFTYPRWDIYIIPFAIIVGLCVFVTLVFVVVRVVGHQRSVRRWRFPRANLRKIPTKKFKKGEDDFDSCAICLDDYEDGEKLRLLPCSHGKIFSARDENNHMLSGLQCTTQNVLILG
jgi:E3 ubiquitin-protein ligase RNF13